MLWVLYWKRIEEILPEYYNKCFNAVIKYLIDSTLQFDNYFIGELRRLILAIAVSHCCVVIFISIHNLSTTSANSEDPD